MYHSRFGHRNRFGDARVRGSGLMSKIKNIIRKGVGVAVSTGGQILGDTLDNIDHPLAKVSSAVTKSVAKGTGDALMDGPSKDPVLAPSLVREIQGVAKPMTSQTAVTKNSVKRKAGSSVHLLRPPPKTRRGRARKYPIQDIWG